MYHSVTFGDKNTWDDWRLVPASRPVFNPPAQKVKTLEIPGGDGVIDLSQSLTGYPVYQNRTGSIEFIVMNDFKPWHMAYSDIMDYLHGQKLRAILEDDPEYFYEGRFVVNAWKSEKDWSRITIDYDVGPYEELDSAISSGLYLKDVMNRQGEDFYYMNTLIEVTADDPETLEQRVTAVEKLCVASDMIARRCDYKQEQAFLSTLPLLSLDPDVERKSRRNALTSGVAAAFPFVSYELSDRNGIFLGLNLYNRSPVFLDPYDDYKYTNGNLWIGGTSGVGKSVTLQCLGGRIRQQGRRVIFIVPKKGHEFRPLCEKIGGLYLRLSPSSEDCPNLMAIRRKTLDSYAHLHNLKKRGDSVLAAKISSLLIWYSLQKKDMSDEDKNYLDTSLVECYRRYGITFENDSLVDENGDFKEMPILEDWYNVLQENAETRHLAVVLARYVTGSAAAMGKRNHIDLNNKYIVLDTTGMPADLMLSGIFWATEVANDIIMDFGAEQSALLADELWALAGATSNSHVAGFVLEMVKTIRGLGGIAVTSTQGMQDLFGLEGGKYGKGILDSSRLKIVMQMEEQEARLIQGVLNLSEDEVRQITRFRRGEGLLCFGYNHVPISIYVTPKEYEAITTSPTDRQAMLERRQADE